MKKKKPVFQTNLMRAGTILENAERKKEERIGERKGMCLKMLENAFR